MIMPMQVKLDLITMREIIIFRTLEKIAQAALPNQWKPAKLSEKAGHLGTPGPPQVDSNTANVAPECWSSRQEDIT